MVPSKHHDPLILRQPSDKSAVPLGHNEEKNASLNSALRKESDFWAEIWHLMELYK
jgi:hypothetical protein